MASYRGLLASPEQWTLMKHSVILSALVTILTLAVGVPLGILLERTDLPSRRLLAALFVIPLLIPPYIIAISWSDFFGPDGMMSPWLAAATLETVSHYLFGLAGTTFVLFSVFLPLPMLLTMLFLRTIDPALEDAGRIVTGWYGVLKGITIPLIMPGILLSAILVFLLSFGEFTVANFLRYGVFPVESFTQFSAFYNFKAATAAALPLAAVAVLLLLLEAIVLRDKTYQLRPYPERECSFLIKLGSYRSWLLIPVALLAITIAVLPIVTLLVESAGFDIYIEALHRAGGALVRSLLYAFFGATLLTVMGFFIGYLIKTRALSHWRLVDSVTIFLFALPSTVIGIGLIGLWNNSWTNFVYTTPLIIIVGYLAKYTALTSRITVSQLLQIPSSMEEAAAVSGAAWFRRIILIVIPLARRGLIVAWLVAYIFALRDTGITMLVYPPGHETLPVRIFTLMANGSTELIAALSMIMIAATLLPAAILWLLPYRLRGEVPKCVL